MRLTELIYMALRTVLANPLRTILTMLGVIIGVSSVVTLVALGKGTSEQIAKQYENLGTNMLVVNINGTGRATQLDYNELMQFEQFPEIDTIAPTMVKTGSNIKYDRAQEKYTLIGTNDRYLSITKAKVATGRFISQSDLDFRANVVVLGSEVSKKFFGYLDPIGEQINIDGFVFTVIGTLKEKGSNISGTSVDSTVIVPLETARRQLKLGTIKTTYFEAPTREAIYTAQDTIKQYLLAKFRSDQGFQLINQDELLNAKMAATNTLTNHW
jgi:putative ABC transport system permease protein